MVESSSVAHSGVNKENERTSFEDLSSDKGGSLVTSEMISAQKEAEIEVQNSGGNDVAQKLAPGDEELAPVPKLLQIAEAQGDAKSMVNDLKQRGEQLDILLMKAESYSRFIMMNQEEQRKANAVDDGSATKGTKRTNSGNGRSPAKKTKGQKGEGKTSPSGGLNSGGQRQPDSLVGGELMDYQLEGTRHSLTLP